jgi:hypothetical protein
MIDDLEVNLTLPNERGMTTAWVADGRSRTGTCRTGGSGRGSGRSRDQARVSSGI